MKIKAVHHFSKGFDAQPFVFRQFILCGLVNGDLLRGLWGTERLAAYAVLRILAF
jgi:hypothetical protein